MLQLPFSLLSGSVGGMGLVLWLMRVGLEESGMFRKTEESGALKGHFMMIFANRERLARYVYCLLIGLPLWFVVDILITQAPEFGRALGAAEPLSAGRGIMLAYSGLSLGEIVAGFIAQMTRSRRLAVALFQVLSLISVFCLLNTKGINSQQFSWLAAFMGFSVGYWASFVTIASEPIRNQSARYGDHYSPNFVRGALIPSTLLFEYFADYYGILTAAYIMIVLLVGVALFAISRLKESLSKDLNLIERNKTQDRVTGTNRRTQLKGNLYY